MRRRERRQRQLVSRLFWGVIVALGLVALGYIAWQALQPRLGISVPVMGSQHIQDGEQHEPYNSDPPTSGPHYVEPAKPGFYDEALLDEQLVHNLEHGYVIIWYNCTGLEETACETLKEEIRGMMDQAGTVGLSSATKLIAVPRLSLPGPIAATSWGRLYKPETFNADELLTFIKEFRNKAPEPNAP
ncbi:MAG: DUF3105 domain-containing protein [Anaerolineae bacterium]|nr:DUF3105 domain-containing protein [Anaerolineae bacterium]